MTISYFFCIGPRFYGADSSYNENVEADDKSYVAQVSMGANYIINDIDQYIECLL